MSATRWPGPPQPRSSRWWRRRRAHLALAVLLLSATTLLLAGISLPYYGGADGPRGWDYMSSPENSRPYFGVPAFFLCLILVSLALAALVSRNFEPVRVLSVVAGLTSLGALALMLTDLDATVHDLDEPIGPGLVVGIVGAAVGMAAPVVVVPLRPGRHVRQ